MRTIQKKFKNLPDHGLNGKCDYVNFIVAKGSKFDELAIMIFSIATKCHICVIHYDNSIWTTNASGDLEECEVLLLNRGNLMFESVEMIEVEDDDNEEGVGDKQDLTYNPEEGEEEEDNHDEEEEDEEEQEEEENPDDEEEEEEEYDGGGDGDEDVEGGEKSSLPVAAVSGLPRQTPKKETVLVQFNTLTRSARKRKQEELMRDVESQIDSNRKKGEATDTAVAPVKGAPVRTKREGAPIKGEVKQPSGVPVTKVQEGVPVKSSVEKQSGAPVTKEEEGALVKGEVKQPSGVQVTKAQEGVPVKSSVEKQSGAPVTKEEEGAPLKGEVKQPSGVQVTKAQEGVPVKSSVEKQYGAPVTKEEEGAPVKVQ